ncbi:MAG TPA: hypothetical protein VM889_11630 [Candidatus Thermoplasmatota archaeon]|nr:hypothetical protein [Candidatus Thermoplasmatota archaeon]
MTTFAIAAFAASGLLAPAGASAPGGCDGAVEQLKTTLEDSPVGGAMPPAVAAALAEVAEACDPQPGTNDCCFEPAPLPEGVFQEWWLEDPPALMTSATSAVCRPSRYEREPGTELKVIVAIDDYAPYTYEEVAFSSYVDFKPTRPSFTTEFYAMADTFGMLARNVRDDSLVRGYIYINTVDATGYGPVALPATSADAKAWCKKENTDVCGGSGTAGYEASRLKVLAISQFDRCNR